MTTEKQQHLTCECPISYRYVTKPNGECVVVWTEELPSLAQMMWGRCDHCKLPYHTEFSRDEP